MTDFRLAGGMGLDSLPGPFQAAKTLAAVQTPTARIDAVLTDLIMPELGGRQLAHRLVEERPDLLVVFVSGYADEDVGCRPLLDAGVPFLAKPISPEVLTRKLRQVLEGGPRKAEHGPRPLGSL